MRKRLGFFTILGLLIVIGIFVIYELLHTGTGWGLEIVYMVKWRYVFLFVVAVIFLFLLWYMQNYIKRLKNTIREIERYRKEEGALYREKISHIKGYVNTLEKRVERLKDLKVDEISTFKFYTEKIAETLQEVDGSFSFEKVDEDTKNAEKIVEELNTSFLEFKDLFKDFEGPLKRNSDNLNFTQKKISDIKEVLKLVKRAVNQTRLIAFNAAIESSRGSKDNRGFGVIASQIRNLVEEIEETTHEIEEVVKDLEEVFSEGILVSEILLKKQERVSSIDSAMFDSIEVLSRSIQHISNSFVDLKYFYETYREAKKRFDEIMQELEENEIQLKEKDKRYHEYIEKLLILTDDIKRYIESERV